MIKVTVPTTPSIEMWDPVKEEFFYTEPIKETTFHLEHSLVSISKWESKWKKAFLKKNEKTIEETIDYIRCMTIEENIPESIYHHLPDQEIVKIKEYIDDPMTATVINSNKLTEDHRQHKDVITSELIYYWMIANEIPFECEHWHLNRLLTLIQVCSSKNAPPKKMDKKSLMKRNASLNAMRKAKSGSHG